jgi:hypothetical protein
MCYSQADSDAILTLMSYNYAPGGARTPNLLIRSQAQPLNITDILPYCRGKPSVGAGLPRHSCLTLSVETDPKTDPIPAFSPAFYRRGRTQRAIDNPR